MRRAHLNGAQLKDFQALEVDGIPLWQCAALLREFMERTAALGQWCARFFALPHLNPAQDYADWYVPFAPQARDGRYVITAWGSASPDERTAALAQLAALENKLCIQGQELLYRGTDPESAAFARMLGSCDQALYLPLLHFPAEDCVFIVDGQPVITFWGFVKPGTRPDTFPLARLSCPVLQAAPAEEVALHVPLEMRRANPVRWLLLAILVLCAIVFALLYWMTVTARQGQQLHVTPKLPGPQKSVRYLRPALPGNAYHESLTFHSAGSYEKQRRLLNQAAASSHGLAPQLESEDQGDQTANSAYDPEMAQTDTADEARSSLDYSPAQLMDPKFHPDAAEHARDGEPGADEVRLSGDRIRNALDGQPQSCVAADTDASARAAGVSLSDQGSGEADARLSAPGHGQGTYSLPMPQQMAGYGADPGPAQAGEKMAGERHSASLLAPHATGDAADVGGSFQEPVREEGHAATPSAALRLHLPAVIPDVTQEAAAAPGAGSPSALPSQQRALAGDSQNTLTHLSSTAVSAGQASMLNGIWHTRSGLMDTHTGKPLNISYVFHAGRGKVTVTRAAGGRCKGQAEAHFGQEVLYISSLQPVICPDGRVYHLPLITCTATPAERAQCSGSYPGGESFPIIMFTHQERSTGSSAAGRPPLGGQ